MKKTFYIAAMLLLLVAFACKKQRNKTALIIKDCSGTYLRTDGRDYQVCNTEKTDPFLDGTNVTATFKSIRKCTGTASHATVCQMYHPSEGWVEVQKIE